MKISIYINDPSKTQDVISQIYEIIAETTGKQPNIKITNRSNLR